MPLRELLYYPPFFAVLALALFIGVAFLTLILLERRRVKKMRRELQPGMPATRVGAARMQPEPKAASGRAPAASSEGTITAPVRTGATATTIRPETPVAPAMSRSTAVIPLDAESAVNQAKEVASTAVLREVPAVSPFPGAPAPVVPEARPAPSPARDVPRVAAMPTAPPVAAGRAIAAEPAGEAELPDFRTFERQSSLAADFLRSLIIGFAGLVLASLTLLVLPQSTFDKMTDSLRYRNANPTQQEMLAFLYLGDEVKGSEFHIRGVVRNITTKPIDELDASIRLYAPDRTLLETTVVRMDVDHIEPDATATFHLSYPEYHGQFGSYSVDFKMRRGDPVPFKDMRGIRARD